MKISNLTESLKNQYISNMRGKDVFIDRDIQHYISELNKIPFVCTTQCCQGHPGGGYLSIMITDDYVGWFELRVVSHLLTLGFDVLKRYERITCEMAIARYVVEFGFQARDTFFENLIEILSKKNGCPK